MGWSDCGINSTTGEPMGYGHKGVCHAKGCNQKIDHGLSYVCGGMHGGDIYGCGYYFCAEHRMWEMDGHQLCESCYDAVAKEKELDKE